MSRAPSGSRLRRPGLPGRAGLAAFLTTSAVFFTLPLYVMVVTSLKPMSEVREGFIFLPPRAATLEPWRMAWSGACTGLSCEGIGGGFRNSLMILAPSLALALAFGAVTGYALAFWRPRGGDTLFNGLLVATILPYQIFIYPLVKLFAAAGFFGTLPNIVAIHVLFGVPFATLVFRSFYRSIPRELVLAARVDGAGFWRIFTAVVLPLSGPATVVAAILLSTGIWNDFLFGTIFAGRENWPMTVQLNNIVGTTLGEKAHNVNMAATMLTALVPLAIYFAAGHWFARGAAAGALKG